MVETVSLYMTVTFNYLLIVHCKVDCIGLDWANP